MRKNQAPGCLYLAANDAMPYLYKIGHSADPQARLKTLNNSSVPRDFYFLRIAYVDLMREAENYLHHELMPFNYGKEFFRFNSHVDAVDKFYRAVVDYSFSPYCTTSNLVNPDFWIPEDE